MSDYTLSVTKVCFLVHLLLEGLQRSCGVFFVDIREWLGCSRQLAAIPFALSRVVSGIVELFFQFQNNDGSPGPRIGWGCLLSAVGVGVCFLAIDIVWHSVFWGVIFGSGIGLASPLLLSHLTQNKSNSDESALKSSGPSFGCIVLPCLVNILIDHYNLNGCYIILSGIILNCLPLNLIAFYKIRFHWPKNKWRLRRRSKRYEISGKEEKSNDVSVYKPRNIREFCNQSFMENLEPDTLEIVSEKEGSQSIRSMETIDILQPIIDAKLKMANQVNNREAFGLDKKCPHPECSEQIEIHSMKLSEPAETKTPESKNIEVSEKDSDYNELKSSIPEDYRENDYNGHKKEAKEIICENCCLKDILKPIMDAQLKIANQVNNQNIFGLDKKCLNLEMSEQDEINSLKLPREVESENIIKISEKHSDDIKLKPIIPEDNVESVNKEHNKEEDEEIIYENCCLEDILKPNIETKLEITNQVNNQNTFGLDKNCVPENSEQNEIHSLKFSGSAGNENIIKISEKLFTDHEVRSSSIPEDYKESDKGQNNKQDSKGSVCENCCFKEDETTTERKMLERNEATNEDLPPVITTINQTFQVKKEFPKPVNQSSTEFRKSFPLEIKVHVVECTVTTTEDFPLPERNKLPAKRNGYRRHSNSLITASYEHIDFTQLFQNNASSPLHKQQWNYASRMCLITEEGEDDSESQNAIPGSQETETRANMDSSPKRRNFSQTLQQLVRPSYLAIIYANVIYEFSLAVLLTIFSDFAKDTRDVTVTPNMVLIAFGLGGIVGQLSFSHWGNKLLVDGSHAAAAVIFILNGLAVAGILWSMNVAWLSGFYALLGFVENGVMMTLPKLMSDFTDKKVRTSISMICKCLSVIAFMCIPCAIGQSRDSTGNYDGLLQVTSCMSVLCAVLCYFLPKWSGVQYTRDEGNGRDQVRV